MFHCAPCDVLRFCEIQICLWEFMANAKFYSRINCGYLSVSKDGTSGVLMTNSNNHSISYSAVIVIRKISKGKESFWKLCECCRQVKELKLFIVLRYVINKIKWNKNLKNSLPSLRNVAFFWPRRYILSYLFRIMD